MTRTSDSHEQALSSIETQFQSLLCKLDDLKAASATAGRESHERALTLERQILEARRELSELESEVSSKEVRESMHLSQIYESKFATDIQQLLTEQIALPESKLRLFWEHLRLRVEPGPVGGVKVTMGFPQSSGLPDLIFNIKFSPETAYIVSECDPMIIGMSELVDQLNGDAMTGALARFCCRLRARYTAQYGADFSS